MLQTSLKDSDVRYQQKKLVLVQTVEQQRREAEALRAELGEVCVGGVGWGGT